MNILYKCLVDVCFREVLIRTAFQSLQLVVTDFLPIMPCQCLEVCIEVASRFGLQNQELNISLTAIGLLWNISDYLYQNRSKIAEELSVVDAEHRQDSGKHEGTRTSLPAFDKLWMCVYAKLGELCVDPRPAVRKSAGQTLFSTIAAHGTLIQQSTWHTVLWQVCTLSTLANLQKLHNFCPYYLLTETFLLAIPVYVIPFLYALSSNLRPGFLGNVMQFYNVID